MSALRVSVVLTGLLLATGCGGAGGQASGSPQEAFEQAADRSTCVAGAEPISTHPDAFPEDFPFPDETVVFDAQDRGVEGVVVTGITSARFEQVLAALNGPAQEAGFRVTGGETEEHDAEANWTGNGFRGRWTVRESGTCAGETVVQVLAARE